MANNDVRPDMDDDTVLLDSLALAAPFGLALWGMVVWLAIR